ncbi:TPA: hypothetical protein ACPIZ7_001312 [Haemophilus influenzae]|uniref:Uncharacterized protein n=5 Tax=Haemophilus influenzae TaxID=727 RepID=Q58ZC6_HAEIF|nr:MULTISPECIES: hypothetical protein [Haemophilus]EDK06973.1 hypothetical protein CGSHiAA_00355 [Haemophilus influenzae PittAA]DAN85128.1 MAG TPA: hypothetical protein [Caudoviricetes sp.]AAV37148.1 hypothetical protein [Haemophilus influenzae biotype aegyptius]AKA45973.1 hypothetical protein C645_00490 [Haemophilus influenzae 2019]AWP56231.1 hypothetical protein DLK00_09255 [Haemophilus influenzae]
MTINVEFWHLVGLLISFLGCCFGFAKMLVAQFQNSLSERHHNQMKVNDKVEDIEKQLNQMQSALPLNYVLRDDYIRGQAILEAKMDALHKTLSDLYKMESTR